MPIRFGRWTVEVYGHALYIQKQADPHCATCKGSGEIQSGPGVGPDGEEPFIDACSCWNPYQSLRIPFWRKPAADGWPF